MVCTVLTWLMNPSVKAKVYSRRATLTAPTDMQGSTVAQAWIFGFVNCAFRNKHAFDNLELLLTYESMAHFDPVEVRRLEGQCRKIDDMSRSNDVFPNARREAS